MSNELFEIVIENIQEQGPNIRVVVLYHGGEPLLNKNFSQMLARLKALGIPFVKTVSNGMLLTREKSIELIRNGLDCIEFSLDGQSAEDNNTIRRGSLYQTVVNNIRMLIEEKERLNSNKPEIYLSSVQFSQEETFGMPGVDSKCSAPEYLRKEFEKELAQKKINGFKSSYALKWPLIDADSSKYKVRYEQCAVASNYCDHAFNTITIRSNGDVVPCCYDLAGQYCLGSIKEHSLSDIWHSSQSEYLRESIRTKRYIRLCGDCAVVSAKGYLVKTSNVQV